MTLTELENSWMSRKSRLTKLAWLPNFLSEDVPDGKDDADNLEIKQVGGKLCFDFAARDPGLGRLARHH